MANDWLKHIPFINRKYRDARLNNAKNVPWGNQNIKDNIPDAPTNQQLRDVYKQRVRQNIKYNTPADPAFPWQERTRLPTPKPSTPKGIPTPNSPAQLKRLVEGLQKAKPPQAVNIPLPRGITIPKVPINIPPGLVKAAGVGGTIYQLASEAPRTWKAIESLGVDIWSIITSGAGLVPDIARQPWWQDFAKAVVERKRELQQEQGLIRPSSTTEVQPAGPPPFTGGQSITQYRFRIFMHLVYPNGATQSLDYGFNFVVWGAIEGTVLTKPDANTTFIHVKCRGNQGTPQAAGTLVNIGSSNQYLVSATPYNIVRLDGQPDTGGNPPPSVPPVLSEPWVPVPVSAIAVSDLIPEPVTEPTTEEQKPLSPSPFGGIPFVPTMLPIPNEGINEGLAPSQTPLTPNSPSVDDQTAPTKRITYKPVSPNPTIGTEAVTSTTYLPGSDTKTGTQTVTGTETETNTTTQKETVGKLPSLPTLTLPPLFTPVTNGGKPSNEIAPKPTESVKQTPQPSNCELNNSCTLNKIGDLQKDQKALGDKMNGLGQAADIARQEMLLQDVLSRLGPQLNGGISGYFKAAWEATKMDKVINLLTLIAAAHNAAMLSRNLGQTLGDAASQVLQVFGIKDHEKNPIDVNEVIGKSIDNAFKSLLGEEVWTGVKTTWNKANRIISSASQIIWSIRSIADSTREVMEWTAENTGKIGNALKKFRVVGENAYKWMPERVTTTNAWMRKIERVREGTDSLDDAASSFSSALSEVQNIQEEYSQLQEQKQQFDRNLKEFTPKEREDNEPVKTKVLESKEVSKAPTNTENVFRGEGEES